MIKSLTKLLAVIGLASLTLAGCATDLNSGSYVSSSVVGKVLEGTVVSARAVTIKENANLQGNTMGMLGGALVGGIGGNMIGKGHGNTAATAGGALAGAALGSMLQNKLGTQQGMEYVVRIDAKYVNQTPTTTTRTEVQYGNNSIEDSIKQSMSTVQTTSDLISVVQGNDVILRPGQRVLISYNNDRPRISPLN